MNHDNTRPIFLLSIDGGGILGLLALHILAYLEDKMGRPIASLFDCITGVSAGGLIALGLVVPRAHASGTPYSAQKLHDLFEKNALRVFHKTTAHEFLHCFPLTSLLEFLLFSKYSADGAKELYTKIFGHCPMSRALIHTIIPTYNIHGGETKGPRLKIFDSLSIREKQAKNKENWDFFMHEVALATSAAPTYFPPQPMLAIDGYGKKTRSNYHLIDGGVAITDPSVLAYSYLRLRHPNTPIHTLSLGVGPHPKTYASLLDNRSPGVLAWLGKLGHLISAPQLSVYNKLFDHFQKKAPQPGSHWRIQPIHTQKPFSSLDDTSPEHLAYIAQTGAQMIKHHRHTLDALTFYLSKNIRD
jgi:predicted acylesterase/phospholipase RssA